MSAAQNIPIRNRDDASAVTNSFDPSTSPTQAFTSPSQSFSHRANSQSVSAKQLKPFNTQDVKVLLLENINVTGQDILREQGYQVEALKASIPEDQLIEKIKCVTYDTHHPSPPNLFSQGRPRHWYPLKDKVDRKGPRTRKEPHRHRLLLYRH
jgi:hypothetical protein